MSKSRLDRFLIACNNSHQRAQDLYNANLKVAESFYSILNIFEIFLRNRINEELSLYFNDPAWIINEKNGFMSDLSLSHSNFFLKNEIYKAENKIKRQKKTITSGLVIAEQSFSFWTSLYDTHHYKLLSGSIIHCFPNKPNTIQRKQINGILNEIRAFRNRVYHNEPICFSANDICFNKAKKIRKDIYNILNWMDPDIVIYAGKFDNIQNNIREALLI
ncbi:Abi family protein [Flavobacterium sp. D11R37]|uniref:hypothetical protein n=1 Tax=Flavobacterium coralii TaxID=2838017 RepID=UPI001CA72B3F|nr:hypothetical protein [Flavobacterium coralii]MBY8963371.1 Abi family protein [Flavobacterium coralii]